MKTVDRCLDILHTVEFYHPHVGGAELVVQSISERLVKRGHRVQVATTYIPERTVHEHNGVNIHSFKLGGSRGYGLTGTDEKRYYNFLLNMKYDVMMNYAAQQWASDIAFDVVAKRMNHDVHILAPCGYSALDGMNGFRIPVFQEYFRTIIPQVLPLYDSIIYHSSRYQDAELGRRLGLRNGIVIPNGVDEEEFYQRSLGSFRKKFSITTKNMLLCVANFYTKKGQEHVIEAFRLLHRNDTTLVLIGKEGDTLNWLRKLAGDDEHIKFCINISREDTVQAYFDATLFVFASEIEAAPLVLVEAKAARLPFVTTDVGNARELRGGVVCERRQLAHTINQLLDDDNRRKSLGNEGFDEWQESMTWNSVTNKYEELYQKLYHTKHGSPLEFFLPNAEIERLQKNRTEYTQAAESVTVIFSKDRALQLDAVLRSFFRHCRDPYSTRVKVLYTVSSEQHARQYDNLQSEYSDVEFVQEQNFREQTLQELRSTEFVLWLVDDNLFVEDFWIKDGTEILRTAEGILCYSLRLGRNTTYCYPLDKPQQLPDFQVIQHNFREYYVYDWRTSEHDFGYPLEVSSSLYRTADMLMILDSMAFRHPNSLEGGMAERTHVFLKIRPFLVSAPTSRTFCIPVNMVQNEFHNRAGKATHYSVNELSNIYAEGLRIDVSHFDGFLPNGCHQECELVFFKPPKVSIIIPCYNQAQFLPEAINSVLQQTFNDFEIIIVNDGSPDNTHETALKAILEFPKHRIKYIQQENQGLAEARNTGIRRSDGIYILPLDADDAIASNYIAEASFLLDKEPKADVVYVDEQNFGLYQHVHRKSVVRAELLWEANTHDYCSLYRKSVWKKIGGYSPAMVLGGEDWNFWFAAVKQNVRFFHIPFPHFLYRNREGTMVAETNEKISLVRAMMRLHHRELMPEEDRKTEESILMHSAEFLLPRIKAAHQKCPDNKLLEEFKQILMNNQQAGKPSVSVIIPCYKQASFLEESVGSVCAQTISDFEIIIVNDGSPDNVQEVFQLLYVKFPHVRLQLVSQPNKGLSSARNFGVRHSQGKYIVPLDADDALEPTFLKECLTILESSPEIAIVYTDVQEFGSQHRTVPSIDFQPEVLKKFNYITCTALYRREVFDTLGGYDETMKHGYEDWCFWIGSIHHGFHAKRVRKPLFRYRKKEQSMITESMPFDKQNKAHIILRYPEQFTDEQFNWARLVMENNSEVLAQNIGPYIPEFPPKNQNSSPKKTSESASSQVVAQIHEKLSGGSTPSKKKILMTMYGWNESGGGTTFPKALAKELASRGHEVLVFYAAGRHQSIQKAYYVETTHENNVVLVGVYNRPTVFMDDAQPEREIEDSVILEIWKSLLAQWKPDLVHYHNFLGLSFAIAEETHRRKIPSVYTPHNYHMIDPRLYMFRSDLSLWNGTDILINSECIFQYPDKRNLYVQRTRKAQKILREDISLTIAVSRYMQRVLQEFSKSENICVVHQVHEVVEKLYLKSHAYDYHKKSPVADNEPLHVGFIGAVMPHKGVQVLVQAAQLLPANAVIVHIYGFIAQEYRDFLEKLDKGRRLIFHGAYSADELHEIAGNLDAIVIPSVWHDCAPLVCVEALALGVPVIAARVGGIPDFIHDGQNGRLYHHSSPTELAAILLEFRNNPDIRTVLQKQIQIPYFFNSYVSHIQNIYDDVCQNSSHGSQIYPQNYELIFSVSSRENNPPINALTMSHDNRLKSLGKTLSIVFLIENIQGITGGNQTLLFHANELVRRGYFVTIITRTPKPPYHEILAEIHQIGLEDDIVRAVPKETDVVIATYFMNALALGEIHAPVKIYFAQGDQYVFEDSSVHHANPQIRELHQKLQALSEISYKIPKIVFVANSHNLAGAVLKAYQRKADYILPVCTDQRIFYPVSRVASEKYPAKPLRILVVGYDGYGSEIEPMTFKGIGDIKQALVLFRQKFSEFEVVRVSNSPQPEIFADFPCTYIHAPDSAQKTKIYGTSDVLIYASHYDSCPRPPMEAMASGCVVVCTETSGAKEYCRHMENSFLVPIARPQAIADALLQIATSDQLRQKLIHGGYQTAREFPWQREIDTLEQIIHTELQKSRTDHIQNLSDDAELTTIEAQKIMNSSQPMNREKSSANTKSTSSGFSNSQATGSLPNPLPQPLYLNLGCGLDVREGFVNIDLFSDDSRVVYGDVRNLQLPDNSADGIIASDILEHFSHRETQNVLREWARVLKPHGELVIRCPSLKLQMQAYMNGVWDADVASYMIFGGQTNPGDYHCIGFDEMSLRRRLTDVGLTVESCEEENLPQDKGFINLNMVIRARKPVSVAHSPKPLTLSPIERFASYQTHHAEQITDVQQQQGFIPEIPSSNDVVPKNVISQSEIPSKVVPEKVAIVWEGSQFVYSSFGLINREISKALIHSGVIDYTIFPFEEDQFSYEDNEEYKELRKFDVRSKPENAQLPRVDETHAVAWVRHRWPVSYDDFPKGAKKIVMQPWEMSTVRKDIIEAFHKADEIWTPSNHSREAFVRSGLDANKVQIIPNGINPTVFSPAGAAYSIATEKTYKFLFVGGTIPRKGIDVLLRAYAKAFTATDDVCLVVKDMGAKSYYQGQTQEDLIEKFQQTLGTPELIYIDDNLSEEQMASLYRECDVFVSPYRAEGFSLPTLEAMACGLPVIVTRGGATDDFVDEKCGLLISAEPLRVGTTFGGKELVDVAFALEPSEEELVEAMQYFYFHPVAGTAMGRKGSLRARTQWTWNHSALAVLSRLDALYGSSLAEKAHNTLLHSHQNDGNILLCQAEEAFEHGETDEAIALYQKAIEARGLKKSWAMLALHRLADLSIQNEDIQIAHEFLDRAEKLDETSPDTSYLRAIALSAEGNILFEQGDEDTAMEYFESAQKLFDMLLDHWQVFRFHSAIGIDIEDLLSNSAFNLINLGAPSEALEIFNAVLGHKPEFVDAIFGSGICLAQQGKSKDAKLLFERCLELDSDYTAAQEAILSLV